MFTPPTKSLLLQTDHWRVHHNRHARVEGYLMMGTLDANGFDFDCLSSEALADMGLVISQCVKAVKEAFNPLHVFVSRYGVAPGNRVHFHIIPVYEWLDSRIDSDRRYSFTQELSAGTDGLRYDAADYLLYTWRELTERADQSGLDPVDIAATVSKLKNHL